MDTAETSSGRVVVAVQAGGHVMSRQREEDGRCLWLWRTDGVHGVSRRWKASQDGSERYSVQGGIDMKAKGGVWRRTEGRRDCRGARPR